MQFYGAEAGEILLAEQKDEDHVEELRKQVSDVVKDLVGSNFWIRWYSYIAPITRIIYYTSTTLSGVQTLGEENSGLIAVTETRNLELPNFWKRFLFLLLHVVLSSSKSLSYFSNGHLQSLRPALFFLRNRKIASSELFLSATHFLRFFVLPSLKKLHLAFFYLFGNQYLIAKRLVHFHYITIRAQANIQGRKLLRALGFLTFYQAVQTILICLIRVLLEFRKTSTVKPKDANFQARNFRCLICQENKPPACTPCGHIFCWYCILEHSISSIVVDRSLSTCPQCRTQFTPSRVVPLFNF